MSKLFNCILKPSSRKSPVVGAVSVLRRQLQCYENAWVNFHRRLDAMAGDEVSGKIFPAAVGEENAAILCFHIPPEPKSFFPEFFVKIHALFESTMHALIICIKCKYYSSELYIDSKIVSPLNIVGER